ncbi:MAG: hypothetical protein GSR80_001120 [Desulfurococcales archaeon]|nr:hypothetical protein [Desulfurococcales archaeon]
MPCPYAERRGAIVYCKAAGKPVNPLAFPCLTNRYQRCRYYREAEARKARAAEEAAPPPSEAAKPAAQPVQAPAVEAPPAAPQAQAEAPATAGEAGEARAEQAPAPERPRIRGLTADGRPARNCLECIFYSEALGRCLLLGVNVEDPYNPPCAQG